MDGQSIIDQPSIQWRKFIAKLFFNSVDILARNCDANYVFAD